MIFLVWIVLIVLIGVAANVKKRQTFGWLLLGIFLPALVWFLDAGLRLGFGDWSFFITTVAVFLVLLILPSRPAPDLTMIGEDGTLEEVKIEKKCPDCAETVKAEARKCRFCGYQFSEEKSS